MTKTIIRTSIGAFATALMLFGAYSVLAYDAGNDAVSRATTDTWSNFTIVDTNNAFPNAGNVSQFDYFAANTNSFRILVIDGSDEVQWVSEQIDPAVGAGSLTPAPFVPVEAGWNLAIYSVSTGVVPFDYGGDPAEYENLNAGLPVVGETLSYVGSSGRTYSLNATLFQPVGEIIEPTDGEIVIAMTDLVATYNDGDDVGDDAVNWAVRPYSANCNVGSNLFGGGPLVSDIIHPSPFTFDGKDFLSTIDTSLVPAGSYCFVFNPTDDAGQNDVREIRQFYIAESMVSGGGQLLETKMVEVTNGKKTIEVEELVAKVSFGGWVANIGSLVGSLQVNFHNVTDPEVADGSKFHGTDVTALNLYDGPVGSTCVEAMNTTVHGTFNGESGYKLVLRAGDSGLPASTAYPDDDTVRIELWKGATMLYDTNGGDFTPESSCVGTVRTGLDAGNISIYSQ